MARRPLGRHGQVRGRRLVVSLVAVVAVVALAGSRLVPVVSADGPFDVRGTWSGVYQTTIGDFTDTWTFITEDFTTGTVNGDGNDHTYTVAGSVRGGDIQFVSQSGSYSVTSIGSISADGTHMNGTMSDTNGTTGSFSLTRGGPAPTGGGTGPVPGGPVDMRGTWVGEFDSTIGVFHNEVTWLTEDFTTGEITGTANGGTYTGEGTVTGSEAEYTLQMGSYASHSNGTVSADGTTITGEADDTNGTTGTFVLVRTGGAPSGAPSAAPSAPPSTPPGGEPSTAPGSSPGPAGQFAPQPPVLGSTPPDAAAGCLVPTLVLPEGIAPTTIDPAVVARVGTAPGDRLTGPTAAVADATDARGRVFVANGGGRWLTVYSGRALDPAGIKATGLAAVGNAPTGLDIDPATGHVYVAISGDCRVAMVDGRLDSPRLISSVALPGGPSAVVFEPGSGRVFAAIPNRNLVVVLKSDLTFETSISLPRGPTALAVDPGTGRIFVANFGLEGGAAPGSVSVIDGRASTPTVLSDSLQASRPADVEFDPASGAVIMVEAGANQVVSLAVGADGTLSRSSVAPLDPGAPGSSTASGATILADSHSLLVPVTGASHASLYSIGPDGSLAFTRSIEGIGGGSFAAYDASTGRAWITEPGADRVAVVAIGGAAAPQALSFDLPGPLDISLAPADVARSVGITAFAMLLVGAPSPIFNSTLAANRALIERWLRRKRPRALRGLGGSGGSQGGSGAGGGGPLGGIARRLAALSHTWPGLGIYIVLAALLYAFLDSSFPNQNAARIFGTTFLAIAIGTAVSQIPGELYVRRRYKTSGRVHVALWVLGLAAACVLITRLTGVQPGYVYGIIGGFTFAVALTEDDEGRMAFRGMSVLLAVGFAAWILRIPFEPGRGSVSGDVGSVINEILAGVFISAIEGAAIGLIPLRFLEGARLYAWRRGRWAILWALSILLFAHVILYPVSSYEPNPSATGLWTIVATVAIYSVIAVGFWWFWRRRALRAERRRARVEAAPAA